MTLTEAQVLVLKVLKQVMEEKLDQHNVQLAQVRASLPITSRDVHPIHSGLGYDRQGLPHLGRTRVKGSNRYHVSL
jgi:hypothetical protein